MKLVITESQYRKLQRVLREEELNEASLGKKLGMAALGAGLSFGSPEARGQQVEPTGKFTYYYNDGTMTVENNVLYLNNDDAIEGAMSYVFTQSNFKNARIPVVLGRTGDIENLDEVKRKFSRMLIDTIHGGENIEGTFKTMSGYRSEEDIKKGGFLKLLRNMFRKQANIKIRDVVFDDNQFRRFIKRAARGRANFIIKNGMLMYNPQADLNEASFRKKLGMGALGAGLALGSAKGQDIEPKGKWQFGSPYSKEKITVDSNSINFRDAEQVEDIMEVVFNQVKFMDTPIQLDIDYNSVERLRNVGQRPDLKNQMIADMITPEVINDLRNQFSQMVIDSSRFGGKNVRGVFQVPSGYEGQEKGFKLFVQGLKGMFGSDVVLPIRNVRVSDDVLRKFLFKILTGKNSSNLDVSKGPRNTTLISGY